MDRVSSFGNFNTLIDYGIRLQADVAQAQIRAASGQKTDSYSEISDSTRLVLELEQDLALSSQYVENANLVQPRVDSLYSSLSGISDVLSSFRATLASGFGGDQSSISGISAAAQSAQDQMNTLLNTNVAGSYIYGGSVTDRPPVDLDPATYPTQTYPSSTSTAYYQGDGEILSFTADTDIQIKYGITADEPAFEQAIRAMNMVANMASYDAATLEEAYDLIDGAIDEVAEMQARTSAKATAIEYAMDMHTEYELFAETLLSDLTEVDAAEATAEMQLLQTQLQASYSALSSSMKLSLMDYL